MQLVMILAMGLRLGVLAVHAPLLSCMQSINVLYAILYAMVIHG